MLSSRFPVLFVRLLFTWQHIVSSGPSRSPLADTAPEKQEVTPCQQVHTANVSGSGIQSSSVGAIPVEISPTSANEDDAATRVTTSPGDAAAIAVVGSGAAVSASSRVPPPTVTCDSFPQSISGGCVAERIDSDRSSSVVGRGDEGGNRARRRKMGAATSWSPPAIGGGLAGGGGLSGDVIGRRLEGGTGGTDSALFKVPARPPRSRSVTIGRLPPTEDVNKVC